MTTSVISGELMGQMELSILGSSVIVDASAKKLTSDICFKAVRQLKSVADITCTRESFDEISAVGSYLFTINRYPTQPYMNNLLSHKGNPPLVAFRCNTSMVDKEEAQGPLCKFEDVVYENIPGEREKLHSWCDNNSSHSDN